MASRAARLLCAFLAALAAPGLAPYSAAAQVVARPAAAASAPSGASAAAVLAPAATPSLSLPPSSLSAPLSAAPGLASPVLAAPLAAAAPSPVAAAAAAPALAVAAPAPAAAVAAAAPASSASPGPAALPRRESSESESARASSLFDGGRALADAEAVAASDGAEAPRPSGLEKPAAPSPKPVPGVRLMIAGTTAMKVGMETVTLSVPMLVLQSLGGATLVAGLVVGYGVAQAVFAGAAGGLIDRFAPQKVLAGAVAAQAVLVGTALALGAAGLLGAWTLAPLYMLVGGAVGIAETARQSIPARLLGRDEAALSRYNARLHIFYESAGVAGALAAGALMAAFGPLWSLMIQPPAYILGAWLFSRVKIEGAARGTAFAPRLPAWNVLKQRVSAYVADVKAGAKLVLGGGRLRWIALAFVLPQVVHRVFEGLLLPVFAKKVLGHGDQAAYLLTASNLGELVGAALLLRLASKVPGPSWVKRGALGLALGWSLVLTHRLPVLLPFILMFSMTWSSSDLALRSEIQSTLDEKDLPRATSFLYGAFVLGAAAASLALGALLDHLAPASALVWICAAFTAIGGAVYLASRRLTKGQASRK